MKPTISSLPVLIISHNLLPEKNAGAVRISKFVKFLPEYGISPFVITADVGLSESNKQIVTIKDRFYTVPNFYGKPNEELSFLKRLLTAVKIFFKDILFSPDKEIWWSLKIIPAAVKVIRKEKISVVFTSGSPFSQFITVLILKLLLKTRIIIDFRDPWKDHITTRKQSIIRKLNVCYWEFISVRLADRVITVNNLISNSLDRYKPKKRVEVITNGYDPDDFPTTIANRQESDVFTFLYTGKYSIYRDDYSPLTLLEGFKEFKRSTSSNCKLVMIGLTDENTIRFAEQYRDYDVECYLAEPRELVCQRQLEADVLVHFHFPHTYRDAISLKIFEYLYSRKPIISLNMKEGLLCDFLTENNIGLACSSHSVKEISELFKMAYEGDIKLDKRALDKVRDSFNYRSLTGGLAELIKNYSRNDQ